MKYNRRSYNLKQLLKEKRTFSRKNSSGFQTGFKNRIIILPSKLTPAVGVFVAANRSPNTWYEVRKNDTTHGSFTTYLEFIYKNRILPKVFGTD